MNEPRKMGRPRKHLQEDHHFRTSDDAQAAGAPPALAESDQADASDTSIWEESSTSAEPIQIEKERESLVESPIQEKIQELKVDEAVVKRGYHPIDTEIVTQMPPRNGMAVRLFEKPEGEGVLAMWKKTRKFANSTHRWQEGGKWVDFHSGMDIWFTPKYWKERF